MFVLLIIFQLKGGSICEFGGQVRRSESAGDGGQRRPDPEDVLGPHRGDEGYHRRGQQGGTISIESFISLFHSRSRSIFLLSLYATFF